DEGHLACQVDGKIGKGVVHVRSLLWLLWAAWPGAHTQAGIRGTPCRYVWWPRSRQGTSSKSTNRPPCLHTRSPCAYAAECAAVAVDWQALNAPRRKR